MASSSSAAASTSTAAASPYNYDVFINHRGPDVKKTFASYLYRRLHLIHGLTVFLDQQELREGDDLTPQIHGAIETASLQVAIFSPTYAQSSWCLNELLLMLDTLEKGTATILPVFYNVKPSHLRWNGAGEGPYTEALRILENKTTYEGRPRYGSATIENWRNALSRLADKSGFELEKYNGDEGELLDAVVEKVLQKVKKPGLEVAKYPAGLDEKMKDFESTVLIPQRQSGKPQILGIVGLGGIGKTTLAKEFFNRKSSNYGQSSCFLSDVREKATKDPLHLLQIELMNSLTGRDNKINSVHEGTGMLRDRLSSSKALVIIDDVDEVEQVDALFPGNTVLHSDTLILITSRNRDVLRGSRVEEASIYNLTGLNAEHSRQLFCFHSFSQPHPLRGFEDLVNKFLKACDGLPLSLIVFGALVYGKDDLSYWEEQLDKLQRILPKEIKERLKISYDALDAEEQQMFLDIACFFIGLNRDTAIRIWEGSGWSGRLGFRKMENRCLVKVDSENCIHMHDHLRDLGRDIAKDRGLPLRLWRGMDDIFQQLSVTREVRGIRMIGEANDSDDDSDNGSDDQFACLPWCKSWSPDLFGNCVMKLCNILHNNNRQYRFHGIRMSKLQLLDAKDGMLESLFRTVEFPNLVWLRWKVCPHSKLPSWIPMKDLRVLQVQSDKLKTLWRVKSQAPLHLRVLEISSPLSRFPKSIGQLKRLERIVVSGGRQVTLPQKFCHLQSLKLLKLEHCSKMKTLPDCFGNLTSLQHFELSGCKKLKRLPDSFGNLTSLKYLSLEGCNNVSISSDTLGNIGTLEYIRMVQCEKIRVLPPQVAQQKSLEKLYLILPYLKELSTALGELTDLEALELRCGSLEELPPSLGNLRSLKKLKLYDCSKLRSLPSSVRRLTQLTELTVRRSSITEVPFEMVEGERERLGSSSNLDSSIQQSYMPRLQYLLLEGTKISKLSFSAGVCPNLKYLYLIECKDIVEIGTLPNTLVTLILARCRNLTKIKRLCGLANLQRLDMLGCGEVEELPSVETLISLEYLGVDECYKLKTIRGLGCLTKLKELDVCACRELEELPGIEDVRSLVILGIYDCPKLQWKEEVVEQLRQRGVRILRM